MSAGRLRFVCLEERRSKRQSLHHLFPALGEVTWRVALPLRMRDYPQTAARALAAYEHGTDPPQRGLLRALKLRLLRWQYNAARQFFEADPSRIAVAWNGQAGYRRVFMEAARDAGAQRLFLELGPFPGTLTLDPCGVNFANALPRSLGPYRRWQTERGSGTAPWRDLAATIRQRAPSGAVKPSPPGLPPLQAPFVFAPLQYPGDSQLRIFGGPHRSVEAFVAALVDASGALPEGWHLRIKEHPSAPTSMADTIARMARGRPVHLDNGTDTFAQVRAAQAVVTVNSSVGLEAMCFEKPVIVTGQAFWAIEGLAHAAPDTARLTQLFATAATLGFDPAGRDAFLSFLIEEYYPRLRRAADAGAQSAAELAKVHLRLHPPPGDPIWTLHTPGDTAC